MRDPSGSVRSAHAKSQPLTSQLCLQGLVTVGAVDCDEEANKPLCGRYGVKGFPTLKLFGPQRQVNPYTKKVGKSPSDYSGAPLAGAPAASVTRLWQSLSMRFCTCS